MALRMAFRWCFDDRRCCDRCSIQTILICHHQRLAFKPHTLYSWLYNRLCFSRLYNRLYEHKYISVPVTHFYEFIAVVRFENSYIQMSSNNVDYETDTVFTLYSWLYNRLF